MKNHFEVYTDQELISIANELEQTTFTEDSIIRKICIVIFGGFSPVYVVGLGSLLSKELAKRLNNKKEIATITEKKVCEVISSDPFVYEINGKKYSEKEMAEFYNILFGTEWKRSWRDIDKSCDMYSIFNGGTQPCVEFSKWVNLITKLY